MHELEILEDGTASMFSGEDITPWHGLGKKIPGLATAAEALKFAGLDWEVEKQPLYFGKDHNIFSGRHATVRIKDQHELGIVGDGYHIFQNEEAFSYFDNLVDSNEAKYTAAGSLFGGKRIFMTAKIGDTFNVAGEDAHDQYLLITNSHDGSQAFTAAITTIRAVCNNTVTMGIKGAKHKWIIRHQTSLAGKVQEAREALQMTYKYSDVFQAEVEKMMSIQVNADKVKKMAIDLIPKSKLQHEKNVNAIMDIFENEKTVISAPGAGTAWGAYNTFTYFSDHVKSYHNDLSRFKSLADAGFGEKLRNKAHVRLMAMSK